MTGFVGIHMAVTDMAATMAFYRRIGLDVPEGAEQESHVEIDMGGGAHLAFSTPAIIAMYDPGWRGPSAGTATVLQFSLPSREAVDDLYRTLVGAGYTGHLVPIDAFWGNRYCEVDDPDGHTVGFHSAPNDGRRA